MTAVPNQPAGSGMTPDRWQLVKAVVAAALERTPAERDAYLEEVCAGDAWLVAEARSLVRAHDAPGDFLEAGALADAGRSLASPPPAPIELLPRLSAALAYRYTVVRELGGGGMARVFLAEERDPERPVVIKVPNPELAPGLSAHRFTREVRLTARLRQANIVPVLSTGEAAGLPYYTMPYERGESLRTRIASGPLPLREAIGVLVDVAKALAYAHGEGVAHRDVKPENILLSGGTAVVSDFGIAKAISVARGNADEQSPVPVETATVTSDGPVLGTLGYMAPEQAAGDRDVDARVDIYAFGIVAYELLAGIHPFAHRRTRAELLAAQLLEAPLALGDQRPELPPRLATLVMRCIEKAREARYRDGAELLAALDEVLAGAGGAGPLPAAPAGVASDWSADAPSVAVLPFVNVSADPDNEYFSDGITDEVVSALTRLRGLRVAARASSFAFKESRLDLRTIAERLGVRAVLEGSVRRAGSRVRIGVQLESAADGLVLWSDVYDRELADIFAVQDDIARAIASALGRALANGGTLPLAGVPRASRGAVNPEAFELYLRGRHLLEQRADGMMEALACFERSISLDPAFSPPHAGIGLTFAMFGIYQALRPRDAFPRAREAAERALALDPGDALAVVVRAHVALWFEWDLARAEALARRALELAPGLYLAHDCLGWVLAANGRFEEAIAAMQRARALDPLSDYATYDLGWIMILAGRWTEAIGELRPAVARHPRSSELRRVLGFALFHDGQREEALAELQAVLELDPAHRWGPANLVEALAGNGRLDEARALVREVEARTAHEPLPAAGLVIAHHWLGDDEAALRWMERALEARDYWLVMLRFDPSMARLRETPRFVSLLERVRPETPA